jgi:hypothetical protein
VETSFTQGAQAAFEGRKKNEGMEGRWFLDSCGELVLTPFTHFYIVSQS